jgi:uncharacterized membrane protein
MQWWYGIKGQQNGPVEEDVLRAMAAEGKLAPDDLVWNPSMGDQWQRASAVPGLFRSGAQPPPLAGAPAPVPGTGGSLHNLDLMSQARQRLQGNWGPGVLATLIFSVVMSTAQSLLCVGMVLAGPLLLGRTLFFLRLGRGVVPDYGDLFNGFKQFGQSFVAWLLMGLFTTLWTLLLVVPGIMAALSYSMTYYILVDNPAMTGLDAIRRSKQIMYGHRWKLFCLHCRFLGWALLCLLTCGIGFLWLSPYVQTALARFYDDLSPALGISEPQVNV